MGFPGDLVVKKSTWQCRRCGFHPWVGKIPWRGKWQPTPVFLPVESHGQRGCKELDTTEHAHTPIGTEWTEAGDAVHHRQVPRTAPPQRTIQSQKSIVLRYRNPTLKPSKKGDNHPKIHGLPSATSHTSFPVQEHSAAPQYP